MRGEFAIYNRYELFQTMDIIVIYRVPDLNN